VQVEGAGRASSANGREEVAGEGKYNPRYRVAAGGRAVARGSGDPFGVDEWGDCPSSSSCPAPSVPAAGGAGEGESGGGAAPAQGQPGSSLLEILLYQQDPDELPLRFSLRDLWTGRTVKNWTASSGGSPAPSAAPAPSSSFRYERLCLPVSGCYQLSFDAAAAPDAASGDDIYDSGGGDDAYGGGDSGSAAGSVEKGPGAAVRVAWGGAYLANTQITKAGNLPLRVPVGSNCTPQVLCGGGDNPAPGDRSVAVVRLDTAGSSAHVPQRLGRWALFGASDPAMFERESFLYYRSGYPPESLFWHQACVPGPGDGAAAGPQYFGMHPDVASGLSWSVERDGVPLPCQADPSLNPYGLVLTPLDGSCPAEPYWSEGVAGQLSRAELAAAVAGAAVAALAVLGAAIWLSSHQDEVRAWCRFGVAGNEYAGQSNSAIGRGGGGAGTSSYTARASRQPPESAPGDGDTVASGDDSGSGGGGDAVGDSAQDAAGGSA
jgi:hypothetical protein